MATRSIAKSRQDGLRQIKNLSELIAAPVLDQWR
jgi:hypothetical protein